jgi:cell division protein FtsQ
MNRRAATVDGPGVRSRPGSRRSGEVLSTAQRFAVRVRARRRRRVGLAAAALVLLLAVGWLAVFSPWATVGRIELVGVDRANAAAVQQAGEAELGRPLVLADTGAIAARVRAQHLIRAVRVSRHWPSTLRLTVSKRVAVAAVPTGDQVSLVDVDGVELARTPIPPSGMPVLKVDLAKVGAGGLRACLRVLGALPDELAGRVRQVGADSVDGVWFVLADGSRVTWGSAEQNTRKVEVLRALLKQPARSYDVSAPQAPALVARD